MGSGGIAIGARGAARFDGGARRRAARALLGALAAFPIACAPPASSGPALQHLDLRLEDGSSASAALADRDVVWIDSIATPTAQSDLGSWSVHYADASDSPAGAGVFLRGNVPEQNRFKRVELRYGEGFPASEIDVLELELGRVTRGLTAVTWRSSKSSADSDNWSRLVTVVIPATHEPAPLRIHLADHPEWIGEISELTVIPKQGGRQRVDLHGLRLGYAGFAYGSDPLEPAERNGDAGLVARGRDALRAWPTDWGVPLYAEASLPEGATLALHTSWGHEERARTSPVAYDIALRTLRDDGQAGDWQSVAERSFVPADEPHRWTPWNVDLGQWSGRVELRLRARANRVTGSATGSAPGSANGDTLENAGPRRASVLFGAPRIVARSPRERPANIVLITLDTTRADALGCYSGESPSPTPRMDELARESVLFEHAWTACNATSPSHASILTGLAVQDHGVLDNRMILGPQNVTLAELLRENYHTAAAVSVGHLQTGKSGLGQGFDRFLLASEETANNGALTIVEVERWLDEWKSEGDQPFLLWLHLFDPHTPYGPPAEFLERWTREQGLQAPPRSVAEASLPETQWHREGRFLVDVNNRDWPEFMYRAGVAYSDELVGRVLDRIAAHGWEDDTIVALTADHGEALGEHDNWYDHGGLYAEVMQVPLILHVPGGDARREPAPAWTLDILPTLLTLAGADVPPEVRGRDLSGGSVGQRRLWLEHSDLHQVGGIDPEFSFIFSLVDFEQWTRDQLVPRGTLQLFERADPGQVRDLGGGGGEPGERYRQLVEAWRDSALDRTGLEGALSPDEEAQLNRLGYK